MVVLLYIALMFGYIYEDSDSLLVENDTITMCGAHQYALKVHIRDTAQVFVRGSSGLADSTGWLKFEAPLIILCDSSVIDGAGKGFRGGYLNSHPAGYGPGGGGAGGLSGGGGGGGAYGGDGGSGGDFYGGPGGTAYGTVEDTAIAMGSGGGAGRLTAVISNGGSGGASITLRAARLEIDSAQVEVSGQDGETGSGLEGSGAGAGGGIRIWADTVHVHQAMLRAQGSRGGDAAFGGGGGGAGGRVKIFYVSTLDTSGVECQVAGGAPGIGDPQYPPSTAGNDGSCHVGTWTGIAEVVAGYCAGFSIQPNPARGRACITTRIVPSRIVIFDAAGRRVMELHLRQQRQIVDLSRLAPGIYFLADGQGTPLRRKIIAVE